MLVVLAIPLFSMRLAFTDAGNDPTTLTTRQAYDLLAEGFGPGFNGPLVIAADLPGPRRAGRHRPARHALRHAAQASGIASSPADRSTPPATPRSSSPIPTTAPQAAQTASLVHHLRDR